VCPSRKCRKRKGCLLFSASQGSGVVDGENRTNPEKIEIATRARHWGRFPICAMPRYTHIGIHTPRGSWPEAKVPLLEIWSEWRYATAFATATATISEWWWWNRAPQKPLLHPRISNPGALQKLNNIFPGNWGGTSTASHGPEFGLGLGIGMLRWSAPVQKCACV